MLYLNTTSIKHGTAVVMQSKSISKLKEVLRLMEKEPVAFEYYIPEVENLINELSQENYHSSSETWL